MKRTLFITALALVLSLLVSGGVALAQPQSSGQGATPQQNQGWFCPWCGQQNTQGQGMMRGNQRMGPGYQGQGMGPGMMRGHRGRRMGPGMMRGHRGRGMGQRMMRGQRGRGMGPGMMRERWGRGQYGPNTQQQQQQMEPLQKNDAEELAVNYVAGNPNLTIGEIKEKDEVFVATVVTKDGSMVEKLLIDKETGWMQKKY